MLKKRIIPCLDIKDNRTVKGVNFKNIRDAGDPVALAKKYMQEGADELVFLDITATEEKRKTRAELVKTIAREINIPFTVGGGINSLEDAQMVIEAGADKVSLNSSAVRRPQLLQEIAAQFGNQCVVLAVDTRYENNEWMVYIDAGKTACGFSTLQWVKEAEQLGVGEILLTSMSHDGTQSGFALDITNAVCSAVNIPVIASGGAGKKSDFKSVFTETGVSAALAASIFHFNEITIPELKQYLKNQKIAVR